jgi:hypothetical protein
MFKTLTGALGQRNIFASRKDNDSGLVRLFRTEFSREYNYAMKHGVDINDQYVKTYLSENQLYPGQI